MEILRAYMGVKILIVEDEAKLASMLQRGLKEEGYQVSVAMTGSSGLEMAKSFNFDLIILDIMLPGLSGLEVCKQLRGQAVCTPILMLTALDSPENIVSGLDGGADDYLVKPFNFAELSARIRTLTRRRQNGALASHLLTIADLQIDTQSKTVTRSGNPITLTATEFRLLEFLVQRPNRVHSRMEILEQVWNIDFNLGTNVVDVYINYLRKKLDKHYQPKLIHTIIGMGYVLKEGEGA
ncbi:DNA-binding response OmpR family regulator [Rufibacter quisquiliarum]|uniref:DNA-binding response OmpR family regulator n=1 Tax=Rufibacter quisquiliarum TaxID=1549639 RepID=A0A839GLP2_9BACT|nr:response regulator transcription factor [Rufibacter quisquiliarum]MBA9075388.1 DNA-binding response OmpR family regulator [Rufibacter quisquiliarum]